ncbi:hypothetical protein GMA19_03068 [Paenibacillus polymyxa E681]|uniref:hypothetical protein n=1 Tax=Paenibacillus polymyxa TaxID=1406 RepID=UPI0001E31CC8|nr:hypothetical protein [Paenibacillus polymyxa]ADM70874.1 hypothetical protein PPE_03051 [Paenibacillus polymyxa E681]QNV57897.1 hypothetical protein GE561_03068 [Paenibacillus polymyxa E681]QNV62734.1 hypothetical protein GMA19_03068 [Paenibacillus polymyxa E681]
MPKVDVGISGVPGVYVEFDADEKEVNASLFALGQKIGDEKISIDAIRDDGYSFYGKEFNAPANIQLKYEVWVHWATRVLTLVVLYKTPVGKGKKENRTNW